MIEQRATRERAAPASNRSGAARASIAAELVLSTVYMLIRALVLNLRSGKTANHRDDSRDRRETLMAKNTLSVTDNRTGKQ
jgi:hypothetical protein